MVDFDYFSFKKSACFLLMKRADFPKLISEINKLNGEIENVYHIFINFFDDECTTESKLMDDLMKVLIETKVIGDKMKTRQFLHIIASISLDTYAFLKNEQKIRHLLLRIQKEIHDLSFNKDLFNICWCNRRLLLFLIEESIIQLDESMAYQILSTNDSNFIIYFYLEVKPFMNREVTSSIKNYIHQIDNIEHFRQQRRIGQNDNEICIMIRDDSVDEFARFIGRTNVSLNSTINTSIYETNALLLNHSSTLIQYTAFYGSIKIFKYLLLHNVQLDPEIWPYAIHGRNYDITHLLESIEIEIPIKVYNDIFVEIIRSHHNEFFDYMISNHSDIQEQMDNLALLDIAYESYNYQLIPEFLTDCPNLVYQSFVNACQYDYYSLVQFLLQQQALQMFVYSDTTIFKN